MADLKLVEDKIRTEFKEAVGRAWDKLSKEDLKFLESAIKDAAKIQVAIVSGQDQSHEMGIVNATLANITVASTYPVRKVFWTTVRKVASTLLTAAITIAVNAALKRS